MAVRADEISEDFIAGCRALAITGTHLSTPGTREASLTALSRRHGVVRILDIDYRPVLGADFTRRGRKSHVPDAQVTRQRSRCSAN